MGYAQVRIIHDYTVIACCNCKMLFAVPEEIDNRWIENGKTFYCPQGHAQSYSESKVQKLEKQLKNARQRTEWAERDALEVREKNEHLRHTVRAEKGAKTKLKKRIANGVCPCCKRSFQNLARHMKLQHKGYEKGR